MRQVRDVLRLKTAGLSGNEIARRVGIAPSTVRLTLKRLTDAGLGWPLPAAITDAALEAQLFTAVGKKQGHRRCAEPDWAALHRELKRKHVTLQMLWDEYIEQHPDGYRYSRFCELYRGWASRISVTMRQTHAGGDKLFVDYAGDTVPVIIDRLTGETRPAQIFVAVLGASNFTYAEASWTQALADWIGAHIRAFEAIGGVPNLLVPDNTKVAVIKACLYEPLVNRTYAEMAAYYDTAVLPARPRRPRDKAKVEAAVLIVERWLLGRLRHRRFYSLAELNSAIGDFLRQLNEKRPIRRLGGTRRELLEEFDRPHLKGLPSEPYSFAEWRLRRVGVDYHVLVEAHFYQGRADRRASALQRQSPPYHRRRPHAVEPPALCRLDRRAHSPRSGRDRSGNGRVVRADPRAPATPGTGLPLLPRHCPPGEAIRRRSPRSRGHTGDRDRHIHLRLGALDPRQQARSPGCAPAACRHCPGSSPQHPRTSLLPLTR
jgi:transposase